MENTEEGNRSSFNEALFKMKRLDALQQTCNDLRSVPYRLHQKGYYCFKVHIDALSSLYLEVSSKLSKEEKEKINPKMKELKKNALEISSKMPITTYGATDRTFLVSKEGKELKQKLEDGLFECEELIRDYIDIHGFSTMNVENMEGEKYA